MSQTDVWSLRYKWKQLTAKMSVVAPQWPGLWWMGLSLLSYTQIQKQEVSTTTETCVPYLVEWVHINLVSTNVPKISLSIYLEVIGHTQPNGSKKLRFNSFSVLHKHTLGAIQQQNTEEDEDKNNDDFHHFFPPSSDHQKNVSSSDKQQPAS